MRPCTLTVVVALMGILGACDSGSSGAVGAPCNTADDCDGDLICDEHNGQASCQEPHGHTGSEGSTSEGSTSEDPTSSTEPATTGEASSSSTGDPQTDGSSSSGGGSSETGADTELCEAFCGCMDLSCSAYDAYPYADTAACMTACAAFTDAQLECFGSFCQQATDGEGTLVEHYCEHAWGDLGDQKC